MVKFAGLDLMRQFSNFVKKKRIKKNRKNFIKNYKFCLLSAKKKPLRSISCYAAILLALKHSKSRPVYLAGTKSKTEYTCLGHTNMCVPSHYRRRPRKLRSLPACRVWSSPTSRRCRNRLRRPCPSSPV